MQPVVKNALIRAGLGLALVVLGIVAWGAWSSWSAGRRLAARLEAIRAAGDPTSLADFAAAGSGRSEGADLLLEKAAPGVADLEAALAKPYPKTGRPEGPIDPSALAALEAIFRASPDVVPTLLEAASRDDYSHRLAATLPTGVFIREVGDRTGRFRAMIRVLSSWSAVLRARGDGDGAVAVGVAMLRLSEHLGRDPGMMSVLASIACGSTSIRELAETLLAGPISDDSRKSLDAQLARFDGPALLRRALTTERAFSISAIDEIPMVAAPILGWMRDGGLLVILDLYEKELANVDAPYAEARDASRAIAAGLPWHPWRPLATLLAPAVQSARDAATRQTAMIRSLRVLNALERLGADEPPVDPAALGLPPEATLDPFNGKPLIATRLPEGWRVYSVGSNLTDDGGKLDRALDAGVGPVVAGPAKSP